MSYMYIIIGPESSGSVFISKVIAYSLGITKTISDWNGHKVYPSKKNPKIFHISLPSKMENIFKNLNDLKKMFPNRKLKFIICTRYSPIANISQKNRFNRSDKIIKNNNKISKQILTDIIKKEQNFIWNYETMLYLENTYFDLLYDFLKSKIIYYPDNIIDGNIKYLNNS